MENGVDDRRRNLLKLTGLLGLAALSPLVIPAEHAEALWFSRKQLKVSRTRLSMGTFVSITAIHPSRDEAEEAIELAFAEVDRLAFLLSRYEPNSPVSQLNRAGVLDEVPGEIYQVMSRALYFYQHSGGVFDVSVEPLMDLYQSSFAAGKKPGDDIIERVLANVGAQYIELQQGRITFNRPAMGITLDGIAKGYIVDRASHVMKRHGIANHLINAGGDICTSGAAAGGRKWTVAIQDPDKKKEFPDIVEMADGAIATSGNYEIYYDQEKLFHHIIDPRTGHSPHHSSSVTVTAPTAMDADALATALFVLAPGEGRGLIETRPDNECFIIDRDGRITRSSGWPG
ncbi:MAG: FAD:protein FMN transferase [Desulfofustis sp.]|nr:FAD:protein FMN transferase [Desulfofustis sp.]